MGDQYLALHALLAGWRAIMYAAFASEASESYVVELMGAAREAVVAAAHEYVSHVKELRAQAGGRLINIVGGSAPATYPVHCLRVAEACALIYFLSDEANQRMSALDLLRKIIVTEEGAQHPISDRYAISIVGAVRALRAAGEEGIARTYLRQVATWVLAQYAAREGLGSVEDSEEVAVRRLFSHELQEIAPPKRHDSFTATALLDLAALLRDDALYGDIENDIRANRVVPRYYQPQDTVAQFLIDGEDVVAFPNVRFAKELGGDEFSYGPHLDGEPRQFMLSERFGAGSLLALSQVLRDRYFPTTWVLDRHDPSG
jgi:hypothetical protein